MIHPRLALSGLLALLILSASGCGMLRLRNGDIDRVDPWPLAERLDIGIDPSGGLQISGATDRPSALVRISLAGIPQDLKEENEPFLNLREFRAPFHAGLFSSVTYQYGTRRREVEADYILDILLRRKQETGWYTYVGICTLGALPFGLLQEFRVECKVYDRNEKLLGTIRKSDGLTDIVWLPFIPVTILFNAIDHFLGLGTTLGFSKSGWEAKEKAVLENMMRAVVVDVQGLMKKAKDPQPPPPEDPQPPPEAPQEGD